MKFRLPVIGEIRFNPVVTFTSIVLIWSFVIWCILLGEDVPFNRWKSWIVQHLTWLYVGTLVRSQGPIKSCFSSKYCTESYFLFSQDLSALFVLTLYFSKYANLKLGKDTDQPEYNDLSWFMMLFACGVGIGLFFWGVAEPIFHYTGKNRYTADPTTPDNILAQTAMNITLFHWGE